MICRPIRRPALRPCTLVLALWLAGLAAIAAALLEARRPHAAHAQALQQQQHLATTLGLTDPALFTEARYTRHLALADLHAPFQDHPMAFDHFPSGALAPPPAP